MIKAFLDIEHVAHSLIEFIAALKDLLIIKTSISISIYIHFIYNMIFFLFIKRKKY